MLVSLCCDVAVDVVVMTNNHVTQPNRSLKVFFCLLRLADWPISFPRIIFLAEFVINSMGEIYVEKQPCFSKLPELYKNSQLDPNFAKCFH